MWRDGLKAYMASQEGLEVAGVADTSAQALQMHADFRPDLAIIDMTFERLSGPKLAEDLLETDPQLRIVMLTMCQDEACVQGMLDIGILGIVMKSSEGVELLNAIQAVMNREVYVDSHLAHIMNKPAALARNILPGLELLASEEQELCRLIALGHTSSEVSTMLQISVQKVEIQHSNVMQKIGAKNQADLVFYALRTGLI